MASWHRCDDVQMHNFMITGNSLEPDVSRTLIKNLEPSDETLRLTPVILCIILM